MKGGVCRNPTAMGKRPTHLGFFILLLFHYTLALCVVNPQKFICNNFLSLRASGLTTQILSVLAIRQTAKKHKGGEKMIITGEMPLRDIDFWGDGDTNSCYIADEEFDIIERELEKLYPHGIDEEVLNDFFGSKEDIIAGWLGYSSFDEIIKREA